MQSLIGVVMYHARFIRSLLRAIAAIRTNTSLSDVNTCGTSRSINCHRPRFG